MTTATATTTTTTTDELQLAVEVLEATNRHIRPARNWEVGDKLAGRMTNLLPRESCPAAIATCNFTVQSKRTIGDGVAPSNWASWIRTRMQAGGNGLYGFISSKQWIAGNWLSLDSFDAIQTILDCFGISLDDVFATFGDPRDKDRESYKVSLVEIIETLAGDLLVDNIVATEAA